MYCRHTEGFEATEMAQRPVSSAKLQLRRPKVAPLLKSRVKQLISCTIMPSTDLFILVTNINRANDQTFELSQFIEPDFLFNFFLVRDRKSMYHLNIALDIV